jgi:hypothetical protein
LARKAGSVKGPVAGWLLTATRFACRDARKRLKVQKFLYSFILEDLFQGQSEFLGNTKSQQQ